jgi:DnaJ-class molecular chaperone
MDKIKQVCVQCDGTGETVFSGTYTTQRKCDLCGGKGYWYKTVESKQETVEKAAKSYRKTTPNQMYGDELGFIAGAEWQKKKDLSFMTEIDARQTEWLRLIKKHEAKINTMYSEEEVIAFANSLMIMPNNELESKSLKEHFEQFKKK